MWENPIFFNVSYIFFIRSVGALGIAIIAFASTALLLVLDKKLSALVD